MKKFLLPIVCAAIAASVFAGPPRTKPTAQPKILREQKIGQPFKRIEKPEENILSKENSVFSTENSLKNENRRFQIFVKLLDADLSEFEKIISAAEKNGENISSVSGADKMESLLTQTSNTLEICAFPIFLQDETRGIKPFEASILTAYSTDSSDSIPSFDKEGKIIKNDGLKLQTQGLGSYASINISKPNKKEAPFSLNYDLRYNSGPSKFIIPPAKQNCKCSAPEISAADTGEVHFQEGKEMVFVIKGPSYEKSGCMQDSAQSKKQRCLFWLLTIKES